MLLCGKNKKKLGDSIAGTDVFSVSRKIKPAVIVITAILLFALFVSSLVFGVTAIMKNDGSYRTAISHIEANDEIKNIVGNITGYGFFVQGSLSYTNGYGDADYRIRVLGNENTLYVTVSLTKVPNAEWEIIYIHY